jgi:CRP-like cAMP-binding protein
VDPDVCSLEYRLKIIGRLPFFRQLPGQAIVEINRLFEDHEITTGQAIYFEGDPAAHFYLVSNGKVKLLRHTVWGREVLLDVLQAGEYFGNLASPGEKCYSETAMAQTGGCILQISTEDFAAILNLYPGVTLKVLEAVSKRLEESQEVVKQLSAYSIEQRVAATLIRLAAKMGERKQKGLLIQLPFSRQDLAAMTGTTVETVSRVMSRLAEDGLISTGRRWVAVSNLAGLEQLVKEAAVN